ncbi:MAG: DUF4012 domain-containing protein [Hymenobacter sp.]
MLTSGELLAGSGEQLAGDLETVTSGLAARGGDPLKAGEVVAGELRQIQSHLADARQHLQLLETVVAESQRSGVGGELKAATSELSAALPAPSGGLRQADDAAKLMPAPAWYGPLQAAMREARCSKTRPSCGLPAGFIGTYGRLTVDSGAVSELPRRQHLQPGQPGQPSGQGACPGALPPVLRRGPGSDLGDAATANRPPDFATSARKFQQFYEKGGGPTTDGVIGLTVSPIVETLKVVGPVDLPAVRLRLGGRHLPAADPKRPGGALGGRMTPTRKRCSGTLPPSCWPRWVPRPPEQRAAIFKIFKEAIAQRDLTFYFGDERLQRLAQSANATGRLAPKLRRA